jgi:hypothetical protein
MLNKKEILEYVNKNNIHSRFYIISVDIGNKMLLKDLIGGESNLEIPKAYYAVKDIATGQLSSPVVEHLKEAYDKLFELREYHREPKCSVIFYEHLKIIEDLKKGEIL